MKKKSAINATAVLPFSAKDGKAGNSDFFPASLSTDPIPAMKSLLRRNRSGAAFTLVEVVLALGIVSMAIVPMMGLLTVGLNTFHDAVNTTTETEITQQVAHDIQLGSFTNTAASYYFTADGVATNSGAAYYYASVHSPTKLTVPGGDAQSITNTMTFVISVWCKSAPKITNAVPIYVANTGQ